MPALQTDTHATHIAPPPPAALAPSRPLSQEEAARLGEQIATLRRLDAEDRERARAEWDKGLLCRRIRDEGLWRLDPVHRAPGFLEFVALVTSMGSRSTVGRRLTLVDNYSREDFEDYRAAGTGGTALVEIVRAEEPLRGELLRLARGGLTVAEVVALRTRGKRLLQRAERLADLSGLLFHELAGHRAKGRERRSHHRGGPGPAQAAAERKGEAPPPEETDSGAALVTQETPAAGAESAAAATAADGAAADLVRRRAALDAAEGALARTRQELAQKEAALTREEARLQTQRDALAQREALLTTRDAAEVDARAAEADRKLAARAAETDATLAARAAETDATLAARAADLDAREAALLAQRAEADDLAALRAALAEERADLDFHRDAVKADAERLANDRAEHLAERAKILALLRDSGQIEWPLPPYTLDETLQLASDHLDQALRLAEHGRGQLDRERQLPESSGLALLFEIKDRLKRGGEALLPLVKDVALDYRAKHPGAVQRYLLAQEKAAREGTTPNDRGAADTRPLGPLTPPKEFALPTAAILGTGEMRSPQHGVLGFTRDRRALVTCDGNGVQTVGIFGQQNAGKSNSVLVLTENLIAQQPGVSITPAPAAVIHCHYHPGGDSYPPGFLRFFSPNDEADSVATLRGALAARPAALPARRRVVFVPPMEPAELAARRAQIAALAPGVEVRALSLTARELGMDGLRLLMGAGRGASLYMMKIQQALSSLRDPGPAEFRAALGALRLPPQVREIVEARLGLIDRLVGEGPLSAQLGPGDFIGLDMRAPWMDEGVAMALFAVAMNAFSASQAPCRKVVIFDEAHKYMGRGALSADILKMVREMRHRDTWIVYASQDPESVHPTLIKLSSLLIVHQLKARSSVKVLRESFAGCEALDAAELAQMARGEARVIAVDCADPAYRARPQPVLIRPTCARPGGTTRAAAAAVAT